MKGRIRFVCAMVLALAAGCSGRTPLRPTDAFIDDDPWLKTDAAPDTRPRDGDLVRDGSAGPDGPTGNACPGLDRAAALQEVARRLWEGEPDPTDLARAVSGQLCSGAQFEAVIRAMLKDPRAERGVGSFFRSWLRLGELRTVSKDPQRFPEFAGVASFLGDEVERFGIAMTLTDGRFSSLMTEPRDYGDMQVVRLVRDTGTDRSQRGGLLARPGLLALHARSDRPSPPLRGAFVVRDLLCIEVPPHPPGVGLTVPPQPVQLTNRQHYQSLIGSPTCASCHNLIDPLGYAMENYDAVGRFRSTDNGQTVDAQARASLPSGDLSFRGVVELGKILASTMEARRCVVTRLVAHMSGPDPNMVLVDRAHGAFEKSGGDLREAIVVALAAFAL
jgi:hypothetical protein